ncbi:coiled-coil domain-containing protein 34-like [Penaeus indicus]|uniref:coiled-coil domain-containing protein 34-like n=1 Tax=Penaeus indicus TaxID=29960 RepID=UPI00300DA7CC
MKEQEEEETKRRDQEQEEASTKEQQRRLAAASQAYVSWLNTHPRLSRRYDSRAYAGGRVVTYYDRGRPSSPTMVNPIPWRRL